MAKGKEINDLTLKAAPVATDEIELQETGGGASKKTTLTAAISNAVITHLHITDTATAIGDHLVEFTIDADGFGDVHAIETHFATGILADGEDMVGHDIEFDDTGSTGGNAHGISVSRTATGSASIGALKVNAEVDVIDQDSGTFGDVESFLIIASDKKAEANSAATADLPYFLAQDDTITIGSLVKFGAVDFVLSTGASGGGIAPTFEFSTGPGAWDDFVPIDNTSGWKHSGTVAWVVDNLVGWAVDGSANFLIRVKRNRVSMTTEPVGSQVQVASTTVYSWDKDGKLTIGAIDASGTVNLQDNTLQRANLLDTSILTQALTGTGNKTINLESGNSVTHMAFGVITWTFSNPTATNAMSTIYLSLITGGTGTQTWPTTVVWESGSAPVLLDTQQDYTTDFGTDDKLDITAHGFINGERVHSTTTGVHPANLNADIVYYVINKTDNDFEVSLTLGGSAVDIADDGTGTHTIHSGENRLEFITVDGGITWLGRAPVSTGFVMADGAQINLPRGTAADPSLVFDGGTGIFSTGEDAVSVTIGGAERWRFSGNSLQAVAQAGAVISATTPSAVAPSLIPVNGDSNSGMGSAGTDQPSWIAGGIEVMRGTTTGMRVMGAGANGESLDYRSATDSAAFDSDGGTHTFTDLIPAGAYLLGLTIRVTETIVGCTTINIGDGSTADLWGNGISVSVDTTTDATDYTTTAAVGTLYTSANSVVVTAVGGAADFSDGTVRVTAFYLNVTPPTQ